MRYVWLLVGVLACSGDATDPGTDGGPDPEDAGPDPDDAGPDTTICFDSGGCLPRPCEFVTYFDGAPEVGLTVDQYDSMMARSALTDGGDAHAIWGFQGGVMLQPVLTFDLDELDPTLRCVAVEIEHRGVDGETFEVPTFDQRLEIESSEPYSLFDLFSWGSEEIDGRMMDLEITVRTQTWARTSGPMRVTLVEGPRPR